MLAYEATMKSIGRLRLADLRRSVPIAVLLVLLCRALLQAQIRHERIGDVTRYHLSSDGDSGRTHAIVYSISDETSTGIFRHQAKDGLVDIRRGCVITTGAGFYAGFDAAPCRSIAASIVKKTRKNPLAFTEIERDAECRDVFFRASVESKALIVSKARKTAKEYVGRPIGGKVSELRVRGGRIVLTGKALCESRLETRDYGSLEILVTTRLRRPLVLLIANEKLQNHLETADNNAPESAQ